MKNNIGKNDEYSLVLYYQSKGIKRNRDKKGKFKTQGTMLWFCEQQHTVQLERSLFHQYIKISVKVLRRIGRGYKWIVSTN